MQTSQPAITGNPDRITKTGKGSTGRWCAALFLAFTFFSYGTALMDYFLVYPSRLIVGEREFVAYHALLEARIIPISVIPFGLLTILNALLFWFRPASLPVRYVGASFACLVLDWLSTLFFQIPMNLQLNAGKDVALIGEVMATNWGRVVLESGQAALALRMLLTLLPKSNQTTP
jgi:hypothetical protein